MSNREVTYYSEKLDKKNLTDFGEIFLFCIW